MNRRHFLKGLLGLAATVVLAPLLPKVTPQPVEWVDPTVRLDRYTSLPLSTEPLVPGVVPTKELGSRGYAGEIWWKGKMIENHNWMVAAKVTNDRGVM